MPKTPPFRCGFISISGRPNVGKSTLLNHLVGQKISITSKKAQTTRHKIRGICNIARAQLIFIDTPGLQTIKRNPLNHKLNTNARTAINEADVILFITAAGQFTAAEADILAQMPLTTPVILVVNKIDQKITPAALTLFLTTAKAARAFNATVFISAKESKGLDNLIAKTAALLPPGTPLYPADLITDRSQRFLVGEILREKVFRYLGEELPYLVDVEIDSFNEKTNLIAITATLLVEKDSHKGMVIGKDGAKLKKIAAAGRQDMEKLLQKKVFLQTWVKVKSGWAQANALLRELE